MNKPTVKRTVAFVLVCVLSFSAPYDIVELINGRPIFSDAAIQEINRGHIGGLVGLIVGAIIVIATTLFWSLVLHMFMPQFLAKAINKYSLIRWAAWGLSVGVCWVIIYNIDFLRYWGTFLLPMACVGMYILIIPKILVKAKSDNPDEVAL